MKMTALTRWIPAVAMVAITSAALAGDATNTVTFAPKFTKGAEARYTFDYTSTAMQAGMGQQNKREVKQEIQLVARVKDVTPAGATVDLTYERITLNIKDAANQIFFDSKNPPAQDPKHFEVEQVRPIAGQSVTITLDRDGEITAVTPPASLPPSIANGPMTKDYTTVEGVQRNFGRIFGFSNDDAIKPGERWSRQAIVVDAPLDLNVTTDYTFNSMNGDIANLASTGKAIIQPSKNAPPLPFNLTEFNATGTYGWNTKIGMLDTMTFNWKSTKNSDLQGIKLDFTTEYTVRLTRVPSGNATN